MVLARARVAMTSFNSAQNKPNAMTCSTSGLTLAALTSQTMPSFHERSMPYFGGTAGSNYIKSWGS